MDVLYSVAEILEATKGTAKEIDAVSVSSISIDSREIAPGALFVAIKGDRFDGHDFVRTAIENGAAAALVSAEQAPPLDGLPLIIVPDALAGLVDLARAARARSKAQIVAVTGSAGKTTTKEAIRAILEARGKTHASIRSFNNHWGVPLMLARMPRDAEFGVFEIGMNHADEISPLSQLVQPHIAVITTIAPAHLENFASMEGIAHAKAEIFDGLVPKGLAIINADHDYLPVLLADAAKAGVGDVITYGFDANADVHFTAAQRTDEGMQAEIVWPDRRLSFSMASVGNHQLANGLAALCASLALGVQVEDALAVLSTLGAPEGRGKTVRLGPADRPLLLIDESYNANPSSMHAAFEVFAGLKTTGRKVLVLGDMLELGEQSSKLHVELQKDVLTTNSEMVFTVGPHMRELGDRLAADCQVVPGETSADIKQDLLNSLDFGDAVMIKGSNGMQLGSLVSLIREKFGVAVLADEAKS